MIPNCLVQGAGVGNLITIQSSILVFVCRLPSKLQRQIDVASNSSFRLARRSELIRPESSFSWCFWPTIAFESAVGRDPQERAFGGSKLSKN